MSAARLFFVDSSVVRKQERTFFKLTGVVDRLQSKGRNVRLAVAAVVYTEMVFAYRREHGVKFDGEMIVANLSDRNVDVVPLDQTAGELVAAVLASWFPTHEEWGVAKKTAANLDWHIAAHAMSVDDATLLVHDAHVEFSKVERKATLKSVLEQLEQELAALA